MSLIQSKDMTHDQIDSHANRICSLYDVQLERQESNVSNSSTQLALNKSRSGVVMTVMS